MFKRKKIILMVSVIVLSILFFALSAMRSDSKIIPKPDPTQKEVGVTTISPKRTSIPLLTSTPTLSLTPTLVVDGEHPDNTSVKLGQNCINTFEQFIFEPEIWYSQAGINFIPPPTHWQVEEKLPKFNDYFYLEVMRSIGGIREIWIRGNDFLIYSPDTKLWRTVSKKYKEIDASVVRLFKMRDGSIWGQNRWDFLSNHPDSAQDKIPVLSLYNEKIQEFEMKAGGLEISRTRPDPRSSSSPLPVIVLDHQDVFWIFNPDGTIYKFDPKNSTTIKQDASFQGFRINQAVLALDGSIYLQKARTNYYATLSDGDLLQFFPQIGKIVTLEAPAESWPVFVEYSMFVDHANRLWLNNLGYREPDGIWHSMFPEMPRYSEHLGNPVWFMPSILLESSDGRFWFSRFADMIKVDGTAWYDPKTGQGCVFTNTLATIVEDTDQTLWMLTSNKLYKYNLKR